MLHLGVEQAWIWVEKDGRTVESSPDSVVLPATRRAVLTRIRTFKWRKSLPNRATTTATCACWNGPSARCRSCGGSIRERLTPFESTDPGQHCPPCCGQYDGIRARLDGSAVFLYPDPRLFHAEMGILKTRSHAVI